MFFSRSKLGAKAQLLRQFGERHQLFLPILVDFSMNRWRNTEFSPPEPQQQPTTTESSLFRSFSKGEN